MMRYSIGVLGSPRNPMPRTRNKPKLSGAVKIHNTRSVQCLGSVVRCVLGPGRLPIVTTKPSLLSIASLNFFSK